MNVLRNKKVFEIFLKFVNSKDKKVLKQKFHDYSREVVIKSVNEATELRWTKLTFKKKLLYFFHVIYVFEKIALKAKLLRLHHDDFLANHFKFKKTHVLMQRKFYWFKMTKDIKEYVKNCDMCQCTKTSYHHFYDELLLLFISTRSWAKILMNFIIEFFLNCYDDDIYDAILTIIDRFLKMTHYIFVKLMWSIENLIDVLFDKMLLIFFKIRKIVFDWKTLFTNDYWSTLCYRIYVIKRLNIVFHSQIDGQIERQNQTLKYYFRCYCNYKQNNWRTLFSLI